METTRQRLDKWLWHARVVRSRTGAAALAAAVRINGVRGSGASRPVRIGDVLTVSLDRGVRLLKVTGFAERRGSATDAAALFEEMSADSPTA